METWAHHGFGAAVAAAYLHLVPASPTDAAITVTTTLLTSGGLLSPDMDNRPLAKKIDGAVPDETLGSGGPLGHRQLLHCWMLPATAWLTMSPTLTGTALAALRGLVIGWGSHIASDLPFGHPGPGHGRGVPLILWYVRAGGWLAANGITEKIFGALSVVAATWWIIGLMHPGLPYQPHPVPIPHAPWM